MAFIIHRTRQFSTFYQEPHSNHTRTSFEQAQDKIIPGEQLLVPARALGAGISTVAFVFQALARALALGRASALCTFTGRHCNS